MPKKAKLLPVILIILALAAAGVAGATWFAVSPPKHSQNEVRLVIPKGSSLRRISNLLKDNNLIRYPLAFEVYGRIALNNKQLDAGSYVIPTSSSFASILNLLQQGSDDIWITIPEGLRAEEIGEILASNLPEFDLSSPEFSAECLAHNGKLFPETYLWPREYTTAQACLALRREFEKRYPNITNDQLVLASLVEREAAGNDDRALIAGVIQHRLSIGMALQIDATLQYAKGKNQNGEWWSPPLSADKDLPSPFNTYLNTGLPPRPIANPGEKAIAAALAPTETDYLYYLHDNQGNVHFAKTYEQHLINIQKYLN